MNEVQQKLEVPQILTIRGRSRARLLETSSFGRERVQLNLPLPELVSALNERHIVAFNTNRRITVAANMYVEDHESFSSNETTRRQQTNSTILSARHLAQGVMDFEVRMGGEIRVEFDVVANLIDAAGNAVISCDLKLFEGTSESTSDLDGRRQFQLYCPAGAIINHFVRVNNDDEGGDYATVQMNVSNMRA